MAGFSLHNLRASSAITSGISSGKNRFAPSIRRTPRNYPGIPARWHSREIGVATAPLLTTTFRKGDVDLRFLSTITTFGTPYDVTLEELRIECSFPADDATAEACRKFFTR